MKNYYQAVGRLIMNLRNGRFLIEEGFEKELVEEFNDVSLQLGYMWMDKMSGWEYCLDFHRAEALRLRSFVGFEQGRPNVTVRLFIDEQFSEQLRRLDLMIEGPEVDLG